VGVRGLRWCGTALDGLLARPDEPSRCTLPITELREIPPIASAERTGNYSNRLR